MSKKLTLSSLTSLILPVQLLFPSLPLLSPLFPVHLLRALLVSTKSIQSKSRRLIQKDIRQPASLARNYTSKPLYFNSLTKNILQEAKNALYFDSFATWQLLLALSVAKWIFQFHPVVKTISVNCSKDIARTCSQRRRPRWRWRWRWGCKKKINEPKSNILYGKPSSSSSSFISLANSKSCCSRSLRSCCVYSSVGK